MRHSAKLAVVLLTVSFGATTLFAQGRSTNNHQQTESKTVGHPAPAKGKPSPSPRPKIGYAMSSGVTPTYVGPFQQTHNYQTQGSGCYNCGYSTYGGYVYSGYAGNMNNNVGPTATDRILANGGTFNNINDTGDAQPSQPPSKDPIYIRPEYPTQYAESNTTVNTPLATPAISAASDSPAILIFKDGKQMTVHNYAIYGAFIVVLTPERQKFPIAALDVAATQKANEAAGYELKLPAVFTQH